MKRFSRDRALMTGIACSVAVFALPAISDNSLTAADAHFVQYISASRSPAFISFFTLLTTLGNTFVVGAITLISALALSLFAFRGKALAFGLLVAVGGAALTEVILKDLIARARPSGALIIESSFSFPSGHASVSTALYGFLAVCLWHLVPHRTYKILAVSALTLLALLIGFSRIYLGVHYPSDVIAGYGIGALWILLALGATHTIRHRLWRPLK